MSPLILSGAGRRAWAGTKRKKHLAVWAMAEFLEARDAPLMSHYANCFMLSARLKDLRGWDCFRVAAEWIGNNGYTAILDHHGMSEPRRAAQWFKRVGGIIPASQTAAYLIGPTQRTGKNIDAFIKGLGQEGLDLESVPAGVVIPLHLEKEFRTLLFDWPREPRLFCVETFLKHPQEWAEVYRPRAARVAALAPRAALMASLNTHDIQVGDRYLDEEEQYQALISSYRGWEKDFGERVALYAFYRWALWDEHGHGPRRNGYLSTAPGFQKAAREMGAELGGIRPTKTTCEC